MKEELLSCNSLVITQFLPKLAKYFWPKKSFLAKKSLFSRNLSSNIVKQEKRRKNHNDAFWSIVLRWWFIGYLITGNFATASIYDSEPISKFCLLKIYQTFFFKTHLCASLTPSNDKPESFEKTKEGLQTRKRLKNVKIFSKLTKVSGQK